MGRLVREALIFSAIFLLLSLAFHYEAWLDHPAGHLQALPGSPMGIWHPLWFTAGLYLLVGAVRAVVGMMRKILARKG